MSKNAMLSNEPSRSGKFVNFKNGKLINAGQEYTSVTGRIVFYEVTEEEYQGKKYNKLSLVLRNSTGDELTLGFSMSSGYGMNFIAMLPNIDLKKEVRISGGQDPAPDPTRSGYGKMFIEQQDEKGKWISLKHFYTSKSEKKLPDPAPLKDSKGRVVGSDWSKREAFVEKMLDKWGAQIVKANGKYEKPVEKPEPGTADPSDDDLPF